MPGFSREVTIAPPNLQVAVFRVRGTTPYAQNKFSAKTAEEMKRKQEAGSTARKGAKRAPKNFMELYKACQHRAPEGWFGIPCSAVRNSLISACRLVDFMMTRAKLSLFCLADGYDAQDMTALVRVLKGEPEYLELYVRNETGVADLRPVAMLRPGWETDIRIRFDADQFTVQDVTALLDRAGMQVGWGVGRPDGKKGNGIGFGHFELVNPES